MNSTTPTLSIILPVLNEAELIVQCLERLAPLRTQGAEIIVVDGGSSDSTFNLAQPLADQLLSSPRSRAQQMNIGARSAHGELLLFLHVDTTLPDAAVKLISDAMMDQQVWGRFDVKIEGKHPLFRLIAWSMNLRSRLTGIATGDQSIFVRREAFEHCGGIPSLPLMEDIALCRCLKRESHPICLRAKVSTSGRRWERHGVLRTIGLMWWLRLAYFCGADPARLATRYSYEPHYD